MNIIDRVKNILTNPQKEWPVINGESGNATSITTTYLLPLVLVGAVAAFIGFGFIGLSFGFLKVKGISFGLKMAIGYVVRSLLSVFILAFIIDALAQNFGSEKNFDKSFQVAAYASTATLVAAVLLIVPAIAIVALLAGFYGLYLIYVGLPILKKTPEDKKMNYFLVVLVVSIVVGFLLNYLQNQIFYPKATINIG